MNFIKCPKCGQEDPAFDYAHVCGPVPVKKSFNKQLREFERESGLEIYGLGARRPKWEAALEKYAKLVVSECISKAEEEAERYLGFPNLENADMYAKVMYNYQELLKEHFDIELDD